MLAGWTSSYHPMTVEPVKNAVYAYPHSSENAAVTTGDGPSNQSVEARGTHATRRDNVRVAVQVGTKQ